jgi:hypothetical protein
MNFSMWTCFVRKEENIPGGWWLEGPPSCFDLALRVTVTVQVQARGKLRPGVDGSLIVLTYVQCVIVLSVLQDDRICKVKIVVVGTSSSVQLLSGNYGVLYGGNCVCPVPASVSTPLTIALSFFFLDLILVFLTYPRL